MFAASLALLGGLTLETLGVAAMAFGAAIIVTAPAPWLLFRAVAAPSGSPGFGLSSLHFCAGGRL